jgi:hypothetical protein
MITLNRRHTWTVRLVLSAAPRNKHRRKLTRLRTDARSTKDQQNRTLAREPWLLATSLEPNSKYVVSLYALRMQIEETFRDTKNHRHGWALRHLRCRSIERIALLLFIAALALIVVQAVGRAAEGLKLHRGHQANTIRHRRVLSWFVLGRLVLRKAPTDIDAHRVVAAFRSLSDIARDNGALASPA